MSFLGNNFIAAPGSACRLAIHTVCRKMITSYFYDNFSQHIKSFNISQKTLKFSAAMSVGVFLCAPSALLCQVATTSTTLSPYSIKSRPAFIGFFLKKTNILFRILSTRIRVACGLNMVRDFNYNTLTFLSSLLRGFSPSRSNLLFDQITRPRCFLNVTQCCFQLFKATLSASKQPKHFLFFYFSLCMLSPNQQQQSENFMSRRWLFLPCYVSLLLFLFGINADSRGLAVRKLSKAF